MCREYYKMFTMSSGIYYIFQKSLIFLRFFADNVGMDITIFWERIKSLCKRNGISQQDLSEKMGYGARNLEIKIARNSLPNISELKKLSQIFNVSFDFLIDGLEKPGEIAPLGQRRFIVPVLNQRLSAGKGRVLGEDEIIGYIAAPDGLKGYGEKIAALYVNGDSMEPTLRRGDLVVCDSCGYDGEGLYALQRDGEGFVKRVYKDAGMFIIKSDNPLYPQKEEPIGSDNISIVGRVHYIIKHCD